MANERNYVKTMLQRAVQDNNLEQFKLYCNRAMLNTNLDIVISRQPGFSFFTPMIYASRLGSIDIVEYLLQSPNILALNVVDNYGQNALLNSVHANSPELFRQLSMFIQPESTDSEGNSCVHIAASIGALEILRICIEEMNLKDTKNMHGQSALHLSESAEVIEYLVVQDFDLNAQDLNGWSAMHYMVYKGLQECVRVLVQIGIDLEIKERHGLTALDFAREHALHLVPILEHEINRNKIAFSNVEELEFGRKQILGGKEASLGKALENSAEIKEKVKKEGLGLVGQPQVIEEAKEGGKSNENLIKNSKDILKASESSKEKGRKKLLLSPEVHEEILEVDSEGDDFPPLEPQVRTPLVNSERLKKNSSTDSINHSNFTPKIQNLLSEYLLKTPPDFMSLSDFGVEMIKYEELRFRELLGKGAYGSVHRGYFRDSEVAIKVIHTEKLDDRLAKEFIKEIESLVKIRHNRFLLLLGVCIEGPLCIVTELSKGGNLATAIEKGVLSFEQKLKISLQIAEGIQYIHSKNPPIVHRDLKPQNILLDEYSQVKIADLGLSRAIEKVSNTEKINSTRICAGTIRYMAPELYYEEPICVRATDVWAYGCVLYHLFTGTVPWNGLEQIAVQRRLILREPFIFNANLVPTIEGLIRGCCEIEPDRRIGFKEIKAKILEILGIQNSQQN